MSTQPMPSGQAAQSQHHLSRTWWIIIGVAVAAVAAILIGWLATRGSNNGPSKTAALSSLCTSLTTLQSSVKTLVSLPSSASKSDYQSNLTVVQTNWTKVKSDAQAVKNAPSGELDSAWNDFSAAVKSVPDASSASSAVSEITQSGQALMSAAKSTASAVNC